MFSDIAHRFTAGKLAWLCKHRLLIACFSICSMLTVQQYYYSELTHPTISELYRDDKYGIVWAYSLWELFDLCACFGLDMHILYGYDVFISNDKKTSMEKKMNNVLPNLIELLRTYAFKALVSIVKILSFSQIFHHHTGEGPLETIHVIPCILFGSSVLFQICYNGIEKKFPSLIVSCISIPSFYF
jgi:hypothetical protein